MHRLTLLFFLCPLAATAQSEPASPAACAGITADAERLACYDRAVGRIPAETPTPAPLRRADGRLRLFESDADRRQERDEFSARYRSLLDRRWELSPEAKLGMFTVRAHRPVYLLPAFHSSDVNRLPTSPNPDNTVATPQDIDPIEAKFQVSLKTKVWEGMFGGHGDLWFGYTQSSRWQVYNSEVSRPFRETNYEPEAMLVFGTDYGLLGWDGRLLGIGLVHQSNGRSLPLSRSWNRVRLDLGLERGDWVLNLRPWWRISERPQDDDNPDIEDFMGRGEIQLVRKWHNQEFSLVARHSLRGGERSRGAIQVDWAFPLAGSLRGHLQLFNGYGESMIDYNHRATYLGLGVSLVEWY